PYTLIYQATLAGAKDCFLIKIDPAQTGANQLRYATFFGGELDDVAYGLDIHQDVFYFCGYTKSFLPAFPVGSYESNSNIIFDGTYNGATDAFFTKFDPNWPTKAQQLRYSTYLGGSGDDVAFGVQRVSDQVAVVDGYTASTDFPTNDYSGTGVYQTS